MNILVIDGQGGKLGAELVKTVRERCPEHGLTAVGTNSAATAAMLKAGAPAAATGENAVVVACRRANIIIGPIGIVVADALMGEVTPAMAAAVGQADAVRLLLPVNKCDNIIAGAGNLTTGELIADVAARLDKLCK